MDPETQESLATRTTLLEKLRNVENQECWEEFYSKYRPLIFRFAKRHGLSPQECDEVVQETVISAAKNIPKYSYDPAKCSFKTWLLNLTSWRIKDQVRKRKPETRSMHRDDPTDETSTIERIPDESHKEFVKQWDDEWDRRILEIVSNRVKEAVGLKQFQIYDLYVVKKWRPREVAKSLGVSATSVYLAKHRVGKVMRSEFNKVTEQYGSL